MRPIPLCHSPPHAPAVERFNVVEHIHSLVISSRVVLAVDPVWLRESEEVFASSGAALEGFSGEHDSLVDLSEAELLIEGMTSAVESK